MEKDNLLEGWGILQPDIENVIKQAKISILQEAQRAMNPMLRNMISRGEANKVLQNMIEDLINPIDLMYSIES